MQRLTVEQLAGVAVDGRVAGGVGVAGAGPGEPQPVGGVWPEREAPPIDGHVCDQQDGREDRRQDGRQDGHQDGRQDGPAGHASGEITRTQKSSDV